MTFSFVNNNNIMHLNNKYVYYAIDTSHTLLCINISRYLSRILYLTTTTIIKGWFYSFFF